MPDRAVTWLAAAAFALTAAAAWATISLWPPSVSYLDNDAGVAMATAKACAVGAGGTLLTAACVCAVGAVLAKRRMAP